MLRLCLLAIFAVSSLAFTSTTNGNDLVRYVLEAQSLNGKPIPSNSPISINQEFYLVIKVIDLRPQPLGVFSAHVDITYNPDELKQVGGFNRTNTDFPNATKGMHYVHTASNEGRIDNVGGLGGIDFSSKAEHFIAKVKFRAKTKAGHIRFKTLITPDQIKYPTLLYGLNYNPLRCAQEYHGLSLRYAKCDFNFDKTCDIADLNQLLALGNIAAGVPVGFGNARFDLDGDSQIDNIDLLAWLAQAAAENNWDSSYNVGDANLDGSVDVSDFNLWNANKFSNANQWDEGDFNGDGSVDVSDFNLWNTNKFSSSEFNCSN